MLVGAFGAGAALAAATAAGRARDPVRRLVPGCLLMGVAMLGFALAPTLPFALGALLAAGFFFMVTNTGATTALTLEVAPEQRGRVMALWSLCFLGTRPLASLVDGALASTVGLRPAGGGPDRAGPGRRALSSGCSAPGSPASESSEYVACED